MIDWVRLNVPPTQYRSYGGGQCQIQQNNHILSKSAMWQMNVLQSLRVTHAEHQTQRHRSFYSVTDSFAAHPVKHTHRHTHTLKLTRQRPHTTRTTIIYTVQWTDHTVTASRASQMSATCQRISRIPANELQQQQLLLLAILIHWQPASTDQPGSKV